MRPRLATLAAAALAVALLVPVASVSAASTIYVHPGESIQAALNKAPSGSLISIERGTYRGNLDITGSVRLVGHDAVIKPAAKPTKNVCLTLAPGVVGICAHGVFNADGSMKSTISDVSIEGFTVRDFSGAGMIVAGVRGFRLAHVVTAHNVWMGLLVDTSTNVSLLGNRSYGNGADGIQLGDAPSANAVITGNASYDNLGAGILFVDSKGGQIERNVAYGNCVGIVVAATGAPGQSGSGNVLVQLNQVTANNRMCPAVPNSVPAYGGIGIAVMGAQGTTVALNDVRDNVAQAGTGITGGGIVLLEAAIFGAGAPTGNSVRLNWLSGNTPNDIFGDGTGSGNVVSGNICTKTNLVSAC